MLITEIQQTALAAQSTSRPASNLNLTEIGGYRLETRIGVGGFGEVWRAVGPGGFVKAVKILFGSLTGPQAETELKSLNRIRDLRHPFLLSMERIEVVDGKVIVVSELADRSLDERFKEVVASGLKGIPRDELIGYLRDAADALDFMSEQHGLQHLDIKPENLLLQGDHGKVGDFGLTKSLSATGHSLVNGFTPLYAPPELFDGRPDRSSDQYSLAIVYQMMLTGVPPFNGRSAAQLTSQHLKSTPDLTSLPASDRPLVARALSKNPRSRFANCRQFIDELTKRRYANSSLPRTPEVASPSPAAHLTALVEGGVTGLRDSQLMPPVALLRPVSTDGIAWFTRPTIVVAIGGLGARAVEMFQERCSSRFPGATLPTIQYICIDSDTESVQSVDRLAAIGLPSSRVSVAIPLRSAHEYRKVSSEHLNWLSRRWLFNIPRSGNVDGMRPLGRLAFVDHQEQIRTQLKKSLEAAFCEAAVKKTQNETQLPCSLDGIDFVLVGSTCGGTSSGSLLDAAWLIRSLIADKRLPPCSISAMLMHGTSSGRQFADMQDANTLSFLKELHYFSLPGVERPGMTSRSGEGSSSGPAMAFDAAWLFHMGDDLTSLEFNTGLSTVAEYLDLRTLTAARREMDAWKQHADNEREHGSELTLGTFGIAKVASESWDVANSQAALLCRGLLHRWQTSKSRSESFGGFAQTSPAMTSLLTDLALTSEGVIDLVPRLVSSERSRRVDEYAGGLLSRLACEAPRDIPERIAELIGKDTTTENAQKTAIAAVLDEIRRDLASGMSQSVSAIATHLQQCLDGRGRLSAADECTVTLVKAIDNAVATSSRQKSDLQQAFTDLCSSFGDQTQNASVSVDANALKAFCRQYCMLLVCQTVCQNIALHFKTLRDTITRVHQEQLTNLRLRLNSLGALIHVSAANETNVPEPMLNAFEESLLSSSRFKLSGLLGRDPKPTDASLVTSEAANFLFKSMGASPLQNTVESTDASSSFPASARPFLRNVGGGQRVLAAVPSQINADHWKSEMQKEFGQCVSVCPMDRNDISVVCEIEGISITTMLESMSKLKPKVVELAGRVHSRQDIPW